MELLRFAVRTNSPKRGSEAEKDNYELIAMVVEKISQLFDDEVDKFLKTNPDPRESPTSHPENVAQSLKRFQSVADSMDGQKALEVRRLKNTFVGFVASWGWRA